MKQLSFTKLGINVELGNSLQRTILFEKFTAEIAKQIEMTNFFIDKINGCELIIHPDYKDYVFYTKNEEILLEKNIKNKYFNIKYYGFWEILETKYKLNYTDIQIFTQHLLESLLKSEGYKTKWRIDVNYPRLESLLKSEGYKTRWRDGSAWRLLESLLKSEGYKTDCWALWRRNRLESLLKSEGYKTQHK